jgi:RNA polymerase sigma-70 factor (ECF subfamily)
VQQPDPVGQLNSGSSSATDEQLKWLIADAMRQLSFEHRAVIYRAYYQGWTTARIAHDLNITEAAVKSRLHNGLHALRLTVRWVGGSSSPSMRNGCRTVATPHEAHDP